jgi:indolepyruvate ferredoxin oxidoreductase
MNAPRDLLEPFTLDDKYRREEGPIYVNGTQALLRLLLDQRRLDQRHGLNTAGFVCGYPGSPVGGVDDEMIRNRPLLDEHHVVHRAGLNEELAATAIFGTQALHEAPGARYDGVYAMWYGKAPGVDRSGDAFHHHNFRGVGRHGGVLAVAGDDPHARSTIFPSDSNAAFYKFFMPVLAPGNVQEVIDLGLHGYALSRASGLWVGLKFVTDVADSAGVAWVGPDRVKPVLPEVLYDGQPLTPGFRPNEAGPPLIEAERRIAYGQLEIARRYAALNGLNRIVVRPAAPRLGIVTWGKTYYDVRQALADLGFSSDQALADAGIGLLKMGLIYPVEPQIVREFAHGMPELLVVEDKRPFLELFLKDILYGGDTQPRIVGKYDEYGAPLLPLHGEQSADTIARALLRRLGPLAQTPAAQARALLLDPPAAARRAPIMLSTARTPYFCSGCPHNSSLKSPDGAIVGAGIGCHIMDLWMGEGFGIVKGYTQMGGEGAQWVGLAPFTDTPHFFQNLGDGTFAHSGSLAIRFAVAAKANVTYKLLYNSTVAMTGGQDIMGGMGVPAMVQMLEAEGVARILITSDEPEQFAGGKVGNAEVWHRERLIEAQEVLAKTPGATVLLHVQQCATEKRRLRKRGQLAYKPRSTIINERVCEGCGDCGVKSNCLSVQPVQTPFGRKTQIHQSSCNQDFSCLQGDCPSFATVESAALPQKLKAGQRVPLPNALVALTLPEPEWRVPQDAFSVCLTGIGGTGVVTVNQILGTAAFRCGMNVQTYDHTGSSQKAGPVVSHLKVLPQGSGGSPTVGTGGADLFLVFDPLVAVSAHNIAVASPQRTVAVVSTAAVPTGEMVANKAKRYPGAEQLRGLLDKVTRHEHNVYVDAQGLAERLMGDHMASNLLLVGAAYQAGTLPIPAESIEAAIRLNGTAVEMNIEAFRWGRMLVAAPEKVEQALQQNRPSAVASAPVLSPAARALVDRVGADGELRAALELRVPELIAFQNEAYAERYMQQVAAVRAAETKLPGAPTALSLAVARNLYKLMAFKDEYEVARLLLDDAERSRLTRTFGANPRITWHLHPTFLRSLGFKRKLKFGPWFAPALKLLRAAKVIRGTPLDLFARTEVRQLERQLLAHYEETVRELVATLTPQRHEQAVRIAELPDMVRGYEDVKVGNAKAYAQAVNREAAALGLQRQLALS